MTESNENNTKKSLSSPLNWIIIGAAFGIFLRALFGILPEKFGHMMSVGFLIGTPTVVGAITIYGTREKTPSYVTMIFLPWASTALMLVGCAVTLLEGFICLAMMAPLFLFFSSIGGIAMGIWLRARRPRPSQLGVVAALPILLAIGEVQFPMPSTHHEIIQEIDIDAPRQRVWNEILSARDIKPSEFPFSITYLIGVPRPVEGINRQTADGEIRYSRWARGVNFRAKVIEKHELDSITWHYIFDEKSFPAGTMDEHVKIGGKYFSLDDTTFRLHSISPDKTRLQIIAHYDISSRINFYAIPAATVLGNDFVHSILSLYKVRSEISRPI